MLTNRTFPHWMVVSQQGFFGILWENMLGEVNKVTSHDSAVGDSMDRLF